MIKKKPFKKTIKSKLINWLRWVTNNQFTPLHEVEFDIAFFIVNTICLIIGVTFFIIKQEYPWIAVLMIEYNWALDNMRHNR